MLLIIATCFLFIYALLIFFYFYHWLHVKSFTPGGSPRTFISVVVAARNEEENIARLLKLLQQQTYPANQFEVIVIDDFSTDKTKELAQGFSSEVFHVIQPNVVPEKSSKKKAIEAGVLKAKGDLIVITDADCAPTNQWLQTVASFQEKTGAVFIAAPVKLKYSSSLLSIFQSLDFMMLQGITAASVEANVHSMCNGANLSYPRSVFLEVDGFSGVDKLASGDDMLLMYKIWKKHPRKVHYLKNRAAIVETDPMPSWKKFFHQRIRWSSKASYYDDWRIKLVLLFVYLFNVLFFVLLVAAFFNTFYWWVLLFYWGGKTLSELPLVYSVATFYRQQNLIIYFPFLQPLHIAYTVVIGIVSQLGVYEWKGRKTK